ncbi:cyclin-dependent kinase 2-associated protein 1 isoform X2 [Ahaetulla prasina]|uniref:cyclin-dependent kinase 2-associated protein 1 isoform X2 n=1 Tax=Ahaetulla prasina TaxID=499056 RepID=UPI00264835CC|nr:cyclin-dependent kinase 2-associated protein 1 isoform X2 [Ahaetulla prasina]
MAEPGARRGRREERRRRRDGRLRRGRRDPGPGAPLPPLASPPPPPPRGSPAAGAAAAQAASQPAQEARWRGPRRACRPRSLPAPACPTSPPGQGSGSNQVPQSKYAELLTIIEELGKEIRPTYAGSKSAMERLKRGIIHARGLVRECLAETERNARS